ncbi:patatin-like phospholipase family protein [Prevotella melaninogenica]|uniref:patatin-like phospholipase family protein n=1 Tax=Prevotella melaninogenica TaxID=28132 RepID=UPI001C5D843E|nr:patatin family protein [Prevotella melaninogenica]MBW4723557.1 patatin family protein [Prevotella melaninogenica]
MQIDRNTGLVLEGGGMRGVFTSGVLDAFMKYKLYFHYIVAVSAGACNGLSYASRQPRRARISNIDMLAKYDYIGLRHLVTQGCIFDPDLLYHRFPYELIPFDYEEYFRNCRNGDIFEMVVTNCQTGFAEYLSESSGDTHRLNALARASSSLPYVSKIVEVDGMELLDGGIVDSIPILRSIETGHDTNVVISTRNKGWRDSGRDHKQPRFIYRNYPRLRVALSRRIEAYNRQLDLVDELEEQGKILVIRPEEPIVVGRMEKDVDKLEHLYEEGFRLGEQFVKEYLPHLL